jgi:carbamoylphosphate synthase small subunit
MQEVMTDPSYKGQFVVFTCPHIGNVGINTGWCGGSRMQDRLISSRMCYNSGTKITQTAVMLLGCRGHGE